MGVRQGQSLTPFIPRQYYYQKIHLQFSRLVSSCYYSKLIPRAFGEQIIALTHRERRLFLFGLSVCHFLTVDAIRLKPIAGPHKQELFLP
jgi:hypothetical protein